MRTHEMRLNDSPFERMKNGTKVVEIRLLDEKRKNVRIGDKIIFKRKTNLVETTTVEVIDLLHYKAFEGLFDDLGNQYFKDWERDSFVKECYDIYPKEETEKYSVLAIVFKLI